MLAWWGVGVGWGVVSIVKSFVVRCDISQPLLTPVLEEKVSDEQHPTSNRYQTPVGHT